MEEEYLDVIVIGAGIAGCALGISLCDSKISFGVFEKDVGFAARKQGYGLTVQHHDALVTLGLDEQVKAEDTVNDAHFIFSPEGDLCSVFGRFLDEETKKCAKTSQKKYNVHTPRQRLRYLLVSRLEERHKIDWGWKLESYEEEEDTRALLVTVVSAINEGERRRIRTKLLVGADGIYSVVRQVKLQKLNLPNQLNYLGMLVVLGMTPSSHALCLRTTFQTLDGTTRLFTMPFTEKNGVGGEDVTFWQLSFPCEEEDAIRLKCNLSELREEIAKRCKSWHEPVPSLLLLASDDLITATPVYDRGEAYPFVKGHPGLMGRDCVTLIGDAAHPMSPFKGQGANQALIDAVLLGKCLQGLFKENSENSVLNRENILKVLEKFEQLMYERSEKKVTDSRKVAIRLHSKDGLDPETRGISKELAALFKEKNVGSWMSEDGKLREAVKNCVRILKNKE